MSLSSGGAIPEVPATAVSSASAKSTPIKSREPKKTKFADGVATDSVARRLSGHLDAAADPHEKHPLSNSVDATAHVPCYILR